MAPLPRNPAHDRVGDPTQGPSDGRVLDSGGFRRGTARCRVTVVGRPAGQWADSGYTEGHDLVLLDVEGIGGVSAPVPTASGHSNLSVSYSAISSRLKPARAAVIGHELLVLARRISELI